MFSGKFGRPALRVKLGVSYNYNLASCVILAESRSLPYIYGYTVGLQRGGVARVRGTDG